MRGYLIAFHLYLIIYYLFILFLGSIGDLHEDECD